MVAEKGEKGKESKRERERERQQRQQKRSENALEIDGETVDVAEPGVGDSGEDGGGAPAGERRVERGECVRQERSIAARGERDDDVELPCARVFEEFLCCCCCFCCFSFRWV